MRIPINCNIDIKTEKKIDIKAKKGIKYKTVVLLALAVALIINIPILMAYEAHIINVTAKICYKSETRTIGYWRNHIEEAAPYLPIMLGEFPVDGTATAEGVFRNANSKDAAVMLRAQLLAMKLNIKHFGIGDYWVESYGRNLYDLTVLADQLLTDSNSTRQQLIDIKDALAGINEMHLLRVCLDKKILPQVRVSRPNGGEEWEIGSEQGITWTTINPGGDGDDLKIDIWLCRNSGNDCFYRIIEEKEDGTYWTENDGEYLWSIPSDQGLQANSFDYKIKIIAFDSDNPLRIGYDKSDENFAFLPKPEEPEILMESIIETETQSNEETFEGPSGEEKNKGKKNNPPGQESADVLEDILGTETESGGETFVEEPESITETETGSNNETLN